MEGGVLGLNGNYPMRKKMLGSLNVFYGLFKKYLAQFPLRGMGPQKALMVRLSFGGFFFFGT